MENGGILKGFDHSYERDHYIIMLPGDDAFDLTGFLHKNKAVITDYEVIKGSMDDVFLNLTGKETDVQP